MLDQVFMHVIDMTKIASIAILIVVFVRWALKRFPKYISYVLWAVVLFRLLCPVSFESIISLIPDMNSTAYHYSLEDENISIEQAAEESYQTIYNLFVEEGGNQQIESEETYTDESVSKDMFSWQDMLIFWGKYIWIVGMLVLLAVNIVSYFKICRRTAMAIPLKENIYVVGGLFSPFVMGLFQPKIYLPNGLTELEQEYIILHEQIHIRRKDYVVKVLAFIALCIHWFNPLVWIAFVLSGKDMEMSCDEAVIKRLGAGIKADYAKSLLMLATGNHMLRGTLLTFGEGDIKGRIKNMAHIKNVKKKTVAVVFTCMAVLVLCLVANPKTPTSNKPEVENEVVLDLSIDIKEHYITNTGNPSNLYLIDDNNVLWGSGNNNSGQLGQGTKDYEFHEEMIKIAENVVHVDYSQSDFVIFLTSDNKLYGIGNAGTGALQQYSKEEYWYNGNGYKNYYVSEPYLLMENVKYARCGQDDIACLTEDGAVWIWGCIGRFGEYGTGVMYYDKPVKVLEDAVLVTGGHFNHAALLRDGTVWTWGNNYTGNCGVKDVTVVRKPTKVAEGVVMVWTGSTSYNVECEDIRDFENCYPATLENTIIKKSDGSYWICGANVGTEQKDISYYYEAADWPVIYTHEFQPYDME